MSPLTLGIDPGRSGAVVLLDGSTVAYSRLADGPDGYHIHPPKSDPEAVVLMAVLGEILAIGRPAAVVIEAPSWNAGADRRMNAGTAGRLGLEHGLWRALVQVHGLPLHVLGAKAWRKLAGIPGGDGKGPTVAHVSRVLPDLELMPGRKRVPHDGLADAAGMALAAGQLASGRA